MERVIAERAVVVAQRSCPETTARERRTLGATATSASVRTVAIAIADVRDMIHRWYRVA
jgi:hypothetical protein